MPRAKPSPQNRLLAAFSPEDSERFFSDLHPVSLAMRHVIQAVADPFEYVYFIEQGVASVLTTMANGATIEVGMIGMEGLVCLLCSAPKSRRKMLSVRSRVPPCG